jgi:hypothetical protein
LANWQQYIPIILSFIYVLFRLYCYKTLEILHWHKTCTLRWMENVTAHMGVCCSSYCGNFLLVYRHNSQAHYLAANVQQYAYTLKVMDPLMAWALYTQCLLDMVLVVWLRGNGQHCIIRVILCFICVLFRL